MVPARRIPTTFLMHVTALCVALALATSGCGTASEPIGTAEPDDEALSAAPTIADGTRTGYLRSIDEGELRIDFVEVLSGQEARDRAVADGVLDEGEDLPNDVYVVDEDGGLVSIEIAEAVEVSILDCTEGCTETEVALADLIDGRAVPYGGAEPLVTVTVTDGRVTALAEQYLP